MPTRRRHRFIVGNLAWQVGALLVLTLLGSLSAELFFVVALIGFLVITELTSPFAVTPQWRQRITWLIGIGLLVFAYIVVQRILSILPPGVLP